MPMTQKQNCRSLHMITLQTELKRLMLYGLMKDRCRVDFIKLSIQKIFQTHWIDSMSCRIFKLIIILLPMKAVDDSFIRLWNSPCTLGL